MTHKTHDLACKVGTYKDRQGNEKGRWMNVGSVLETDDGGKIILLNRTFNPAGVMNPDGRDTVMLSMFEPKSDQGGSAPPPKSAPAPRQSSGIDRDEIPFASYERGSIA